MKKATKYQYIHVPLNLLVHAAANKLKSPLKVYLALKCLYEGEIIIDDTVKNDLREYLNYKTIKSIEQNIKILEDLEWIRPNTLTGKTHIITGISRIPVAKPFYDTKHLFDQNNILHLDAYIGAYLFKYIHRYSNNKYNEIDKKINWNLNNPHGIIKEPGMRKGFLKKYNYKLFKPISIKGLEKLSGIKYDQIRILKKAAIRMGLIEVKSKRFHVQDSPRITDYRTRRTLSDCGMFETGDRIYKRFPDEIRLTDWNKLR